MNGKPEVAFGLLTRIVQTAMMFAAAVLVVLRMPTAEQGYYWAIAGLGALVQVCEFGLTQVVMQTAGHYRAAGDGVRLQKFWRTARLAAALLAPFAALVTIGAGFLLFGEVESGTAPAWRGPWIAFVITLAATQILTPAIGYIEGAVSVADAWRFQSALETGAGIALIAALTMNAGLWSLVLYAFARLAAIATWLYLRRTQFPLRPQKWFEAAEWQREIWPFQWRLAVTGVTTFLIYRAFTPIVLTGIGAEAAARFGLSLAVMAGWLAITIVWPSSQIARIGRLASERKIDEVRWAFRSMLAGSTALAAGGAALICAALWLLERAGLPFAERSAGLAATALLLAAAVIHHVVFCAAVLLRSARRDPMLAYSVAGGAITVCALWYAAQSGDLGRVAIAYLLCSLAGLAMTFHVFRARLPDWREYLLPR